MQMDANIRFTFLCWENYWNQHQQVATLLDV